MRKLLVLLSLVTLSVSGVNAQGDVRNVIYMIGDGMGLASVSMMQLENNFEATIFDRADNVALTKTYSMDNRVTDSAASGTALSSGVKTNNTYIGVDKDGASLFSVAELAAQKGMPTGVVVTTYLQHATPAAFYAHCKSRHDSATITRQLVASDMDVAVGGGMEFFREVYGDEVSAQEALRGAGFDLVRSMTELEAAEADSRVMALLADKEVGADSGDYLARATGEALRLLNARSDGGGFFLMVEGSLIDGMGHANDATAMQREMEGFMSAVEVAVKFAEQHPGTLVVVTADHETGGLSIVSNDADFNLSEQGVSYCFATKGHSASMVPVYLYGTGAELINGVMENSELGAKIKDIVDGILEQDDIYEYAADEYVELEW